MLAEMSIFDIGVFILCPQIWLMKVNTKQGTGAADEALGCQHLLRSSAADVKRKERKERCWTGLNGD